jgi:uncharacterized membrane protein YbjE (DUF340 family)
MEDEQINKMIETNDDSREDSIFAMARDFYNRKMLSVVILVWVWAIIFFAGIAYSGARFFEADEVKQQIMYASIFICCFQGICLMKIFAWQMIHRNSINRKIKKLQLSIAEFNQTLKNT